MGRSSAENTAVRKQEFLEKFTEEGGIVRTASAIGVTRKCVWEWVKDDPEFASELELLKQDRVQIIKEQLFNWVMQPDQKLSMPAFLSAMALLSHYDPKGNWSSKTVNKTTEQKTTITRIEVVKDYGKGQLIQGEVRELPLLEVKTEVSETT